MSLPPTVHIIDDDASIRRALERLLRAAGLNCRTFASGDEFFKEVKPNAIGCIVMDISMPGMNGHELQAKLEEKGFCLAVIALSAMDKPETRELARKLGAVTFFRKPVDDQALLDAIYWAMD